MQANDFSAKIIEMVGEVGEPLPNHFSGKTQGAGELPDFVIVEEFSAIPEPNRSVIAAAMLRRKGAVLEPAADH